MSEKRTKKKKPYSSYRVGNFNPQAEIDFFNFHNGTADVAEASAESLGSEGECSDGECCEAMELFETKRYVRRYYIRPYDVFCSNKAEIIMALIEHEDEDCIIYTLNNLGDVKDTNKLTSNDIIFYYEDEVLYDKNHVRIMDYKLNIKNEENREKVNVETTSDARLNDIYDDRLTDLSDLEEALNLDFPKLNEATSSGVCCICGEKYDNYGNNAEPYAHGRCCDACNLKFVIPARIDGMRSENETEED